MSAIRGDRGKSVERLTEKHVKKSNGYYMKCSEHCQNETLQCGECDELDRFVDRLGSIEDILGDDYNLDRLRELVEADRDGRCVVMPVRGYTDKDGEQALSSAMNTCFYHNNPVTRYIADAVAEKLTREAAEASLKGENDA